MINLTLCKKIKLLRENRGLSQKSVADFIGVKRESYTRYESGTRGIPESVLKRIAHFFNVSVDFLLNEENNQKYFTFKDVDSDNPNGSFYQKAEPFTASHKQQELIKMLNAIKEKTGNSDYLEKLFSEVKEDMEKIVNSDD